MLDGAFVDCGNLTEVSLPTTLSFILCEAFAYCDALTTITIPRNILSIDDDAFYEDYNLTNIIVNKSENNISGAPQGATNATVVWSN